MIAESQRLREEVGHLRIALESNRRIGAAVGIVMLREALAYQAAFQRLVHASQGSRRKLRDVADEVVYTGALPDGAATVA